MDHIRTEIWDLLYGSGPQTVEQIAGNLRIDAITVTEVIAHEWFEVLDSKVQIATRRPPDALQSLIE